MKRGTLLAAICHRLARTRVATLASAALGDVELAEAGEVDLLAALERLLDRADHGVDRVAGVLLAQAALVRDLVDEFRLGHGSSLRGPPRGIVMTAAKLTALPDALGPIVALFPQIAGTRAQSVGVVTPLNARWAAEISRSAAFRSGLGRGPRGPAARLAGRVADARAARGPRGGGSSRRRPRPPRGAARTACAAGAASGGASARGRRRGRRAPCAGRSGRARAARSARRPARSRGGRRARRRRRRRPVVTCDLRGVAGAPASSSRAGSARASGPASSDAVGAEHRAGPDVGRQLAQVIECRAGVSAGVIGVGARISRSCPSPASPGSSPSASA